jgi:hypothetical protein
MSDTILTLGTSYQQKTDDELFILAGQFIEPTVSATSGILGEEYELGIIHDARELGLRVIKRLSTELHSVVCGTKQQDSHDRDLIIKAVGGDKLILTTVVASVLVTALGVSPYVATPASIIIVRRILSPTGEEICSYWAEKNAKIGS